MPAFLRHRFDKVSKRRRGNISMTFITKITHGSAVALLYYENGLALHDSVTV